MNENSSTNWKLMELNRLQLNILNICFESNDFKINVPEMSDDNRDVIIIIMILFTCRSADADPDV